MTASVFADLEFRTKLEKMHPFRGLGEPEDIARTAVFLASEDCSWITGVGLPVDGGYTAIHPKGKKGTSEKRVETW